MWNLIDFKTSSVPSRDTFPKNLAEVDYPPSFGLASLEKCAWNNVLIGNINLWQFEGPGAIKKVLYGEAPPRGPTTYTFMYRF